VGGVSLERVERYLEAIERLDRDINAFIEVNPRAKEEAQGSRGKLEGMVVAVKSNINVRGLRATCASKTLEDYVSPYDATVVRRIREEYESGALLSGELKQILAEKVSRFLEEHQERREEAKELYHLFTREGQLAKTMWEKTHGLEG
jgi:uncharacterized protein (UPF0335 family)